MPVIQMNDPFAAGVGAADSWAQGQNDAKAKALELAHRKAQEDQAQSNSDRSFALEKDTNAQTQARADRLATHDIARDDAQTKISQEVEKRAEQLEPLLRQEAQARIDAAHDEHKAAGLDRQLKEIQLKVAKVTAGLAPQMAQAALQQARASVAQTVAQTQHEQAATGHDLAETRLTNQYTANLAKGLTKTGGNPLGHETTESDYERLTPAGQQAWNALSASNNKATPGATAALITASQLPDSDKHYLRSMLGTAGGRGQATISEGAQTGQDRYANTQAMRAAASAAKTGGEYYAAIAPSPKFMGLPLGSRMKIRSILNTPGITPQIFEQGMEKLAAHPGGGVDESTGMSSEEAQALLDIWK